MSSSNNIRLLSWFNFCLDFRIYNAIAIIYFAQITGSYALALGIFSISTIATSIFEVPTGVFSDIIGRKKTLIIGQVSTIFSIFFYALGGTFTVLVAGAILEGLARSLYSGNNSALLYDSLKEAGKEDEYSQYEGKVNSMFQFALAISALIGTVVLSFESFQFLFWISLVPQVIGFFIALAIVEPRIHTQENTNIFSHVREAFMQFRINTKLRNLSIASIIDNAINEPIHTFYPAFMATLWPSWAIPLAKTLSHIFAATGFRLAGRIIHRYGALRTLKFENILNFIISTFIIIFPSIATPLIRSITSLGYGIGTVAQNTLFQREFTDKQRATMGSLNSLVSNILFALCTYILGLIADSVGIYYALLGAQILSILSVILYRKILK